MSNHLIYDGECPFCSRFVKWVRLKEAVGSIRLIDARRGGPEVEEARRAGFDLDEGMVLKLDGRFYHGDACVHALALMSTRSGAFNRLVYQAFRSPRAAAVLYPILRSARNATLAILGRRRIEAS